MIKKIFVIGFIALFSALASGATIQCTGTVEKIGLHANDRLMVRLSSMNTAVFVCNTTTEWNVPGTTYKTSAETCKSILSMFMHAKSIKAEMGTVWFDGDDVPASCNAWGNWKSANVRYFLY